jgi:hypothetical protein
MVQVMKKAEADLATQALGPARRFYWNIATASAAGM